MAHGTLTASLEKSIDSRARDLIHSIFKKQTEPHFEKYTEPHFEKYTEPHFEKYTEPHFEKYTEPHFEKYTEERDTFMRKEYNCVLQRKKKGILLNLS